MPSALSPDVTTDNRADTEDRCLACRHPRSEHDILGVRFCTATASSALSRGCICR
ncbi:RGCVC family protein [Actinosynnema sp. NPDC050801]|uniref:RGCVC family protein n=1 Tax=unclassified Actinosynnema TaxID=2637065 RepID=UPI00340B2B2F